MKKAIMLILATTIATSAMAGSSQAGTLNTIIQSFKEGYAEGVQHKEEAVVEKELKQQLPPVSNEVLVDFEHNATQAQNDNAFDNIKYRQAEFTGNVRQVFSPVSWQKNRKEYTVALNGSVPINCEVSKDVAISLRKGDTFTCTGTVSSKSTGIFGYTTISLKLTEESK